MTSEGKTPHPFDIAVGARVRAARVSRGMSQAALAEQIGLTFQQVQKYERGANRISASKLAEIAKVLGANPGDFFDGLEAPGKGAVDFSMFSQPGVVELALAYSRLTSREQSAVLRMTRTLARMPDAEGES